MSYNDIVIVGSSMISSLGLNSAQTAASIRAGLSGFTESSIMDKSFIPFVLSVLPDDVLPDLSDQLVKKSFLTYRESRLLKLTNLAFKEITEFKHIDYSSIPLYIGLPEIQTIIPITPDQFIENLGIQCGECFDQAHSRVFQNGRSSGLLAIHTAKNNLQSGSIDIVIAGGVDTYLDLYILGTLDMENRINSETTMDGFTPGEGAAFLILTTSSYAKENGLDVIGIIKGSAAGEEKGHLYSDEPYRGDGLSSTFDKLIENCGELPGKIQTVFSSMNGENHFAKEWGVSYIRHTDFIDEEFRIEHPADCIGDTGAACGPMMIGMALTGFKKGFLAEPALIYASSDNASRSACVVTSNKGI